jgi:hypothetical protein
MSGKYILGIDKENNTYCIMVLVCISYATKSEFTSTITINSKKRDIVLLPPSDGSDTKVDLGSITYYDKYSPIKINESNTNVYIFQKAIDKINGAIDKINEAVIAVQAKQTAANKASEAAKAATIAEEAAKKTTGAAAKTAKETAVKAANDTKAEAEAAAKAAAKAIANAITEANAAKLAIPVINLQIIKALCSFLKLDGKIDLEIIVNNIVSAAYSIKAADESATAAAATAAATATAAVATVPATAAAALTQIQIDEKKNTNVSLDKWLETHSFNSGESKDFNNKTIKFVDKFKNDYKTQCFYFESDKEITISIINQEKKIKDSGPFPYYIEFDYTRSDKSRCIIN